MGVHRILTGEGAEIYLPFAESRLRELVSMVGDGTASQVFSTGAAKIWVRVVGDEHYINIAMEGDGYVFEFATSGKPLKRQPTGIVDSIFGDVPMYATAWVQTDVVVDEGKIVIEPRISHRTESVSQNYSINRRALQVSHVNEGVVYPQADAAKRAAGVYDRIVQSSFAPGHSFSGGPIWQQPLSQSTRVAITVQTGFPFAAKTRDVSFDLPLGVADSLEDFSEYRVSTNADWPREGAVQTVTHSKHGTREFGITVDASGKFHIYPLAANTLHGYSYDGDSVDPKYVHHLVPKYPTWMFVAPRTMRDFAANTGGKSLNDFYKEWPDYEWKFNHLGTKACAVVFCKEQFVNDDAYWAADATTEAWTKAKWDDFFWWNLGPFEDTMLDQTGYTKDGNDIYMYGPGLVEVEIKITLTGPNLKDFVSELVLVEKRAPHTAVECTVLAGYSYIDIPTKNVSAGDLLTLDLEYYYAKDSTIQVNGYTTNPDKYFWRLRNLTTGNTVLYKDGFPIVAYDMSCLAFAFKLQPFTYHYVTSPKKKTVAPGGPESYSTEWRAEQTALWLVHSAESVTILYPDTMSAENKQAVVDAVLFDPAAYVEQVTGMVPDQRIVPLSFAEDGWVTPKMQQLRDYVAYGRHYIGDTTWHVWDDPDIYVHGRNYFNGSYLYYKASSTIRQRPAWTEVPQYIIAEGGNVLQNFYATHPRWGWIAYMGGIRRLLAITPYTTFFAHPNGTIGIYTNAFLYFPDGIPFSRSGTEVSNALYLCDTLENFDVTKIEHCIFDYIRLQATTPTGGAAEPLETSFMSMYNEAIVRSVSEETIEPGEFQPINKSEVKAVFKYKSKEWWPCGGVGDHDEPNMDIEVLQYGCSFMGQDWYRLETMITGSTSVDWPYISFVPQTMGSMLGTSFMNVWSSQKIIIEYESGIFGNYQYWPDNPLFHNTASASFRWPYTFTNPQIVMG
jgi:hypothetical protein